MLFKRVDLPLDDHDYWFAALARDQAGNRFLYTPIKVHSLVHHGRLDPSFGTEGQVYLRRVENRDYSAFHALPLSDGSTLVLGGDAPYWELARISARRFGATMALPPTPAGLRQYPHPGAPNTLAYSVTDGIILPLEDGSYLLAGTWWKNYAYQTQSRLFLLRSRPQDPPPHAEREWNRGTHHGATPDTPSSSPPLGIS
jgi:hypothetical protein